MPRPPGGEGRKAKVGGGSGPVITREPRVEAQRRLFTRLKEEVLRGKPDFRARKLVFRGSKPVFASGKEVLATRKEDFTSDCPLFSRRKEHISVGKDVFGLSNALFESGKQGSCPRKGEVGAQQPAVRSQSLQGRGLRGYFFPRSAGSRLQEVPTQGFLLGPGDGDGEGGRRRLGDLDSGLIPRVIILTGRQQYGLLVA